MPMDLGHWKRPTPRIVAKKSARALDTEGWRVVTIVTTMNLDRLQVHRKWEMSVEDEDLHLPLPEPPTCEPSR